MSSPVSNAGAKQAEIRHSKTSRIREEAKSAIMTEQLAYLLAHGKSCKGGCPDCTRLRAVEEALLRPFRVKFYASAASGE